MSSQSTVGRLPEIKLLIIDCDRLFAEALRLTLLRAGFTDVQVVDGRAHAMKPSRHHPPDVVLLDLGVDSENGLAVGRGIIEFFPEAKVIALTAIDDPAMVKEALRLGFRGYITKNTKLPHFVRSIREAFEGHIVVSTPERRLRLLDPATAMGRDAALLFKHLTRRELDVLRLLAQGFKSQQIAIELHIAPNTVRTHIQSMLEKLQVHSRLEAVTFALQHGLVQAWPRGESSQGRHSSGAVT